jgi:hypothetical protein
MEIVKSREEFLYALNAYLPLNCHGVEIGVLNGGFSKQILRIINPKTLVLIDPYEVNGVKYNSGLTTAYSTEQEYLQVLKTFQSEIESGQVIVDRRFSYDAVKGCSDGVFDFVYLDGDHTYEGVKRDLHDWLSKLTKEGIMSGHDYIDLADFGIIQAVDEFCKEHGFEMIILNENGGDWACGQICVHDWEWCGSLAIKCTKCGKIEKDENA